MEKQASAFKISKYLSHINGDWILPLSFMVTYIINIFLYYLGLCFVENTARSIIFIIGNIIFLIGCIYILIRTISKVKINRKNLFLLILVFFYYGLNYTIAIVNYGLSGQIASYLSRFIVICLPTYLAGIYTAINHSENTLLQKLESISFFVFPAALIYFNGGVFQCNPFNYGANLGILGYTNVAYTLCPLLVTHFIQLVDNAPLRIPLFKQNLRRPQLIRAILIGVYFIDILLTGTRGAYVSLAVLFVFLLLFQIIKKESIRRSITILLIMAIVFCIGISPIAPSFMHRVTRINPFLKSLAQGELSTTEREDTALINNNLDVIINSDQLIPSMSTEQPTDAPTEDESSSTLSQVYGNVTNRGTMFKIAWLEFLKSPLVGMGPFGFREKYDTYPHSVLMETLCDTGIIGTAILIILLFISFSRIIRLAWKSKSVRYLLLFFIYYAVTANHSGSAWDYAPMLCALGYGLALTNVSNVEPVDIIHS